MANTASLTEEPGLSEAPQKPTAPALKRDDLMTETEAGSANTGQDLRALNNFDESELQKAASCEKRAQKLSGNIAEMENSIQMVRIFLSTSEAVEELLLQSQNMLELCQQLSDPDSRDALAETFTEISYHIDDIVEQANYNDQTLTRAVVSESEGEASVFQDIPLALTTQALNLPKQTLSFRTDAQIIDTAMRVELAINKVRTRRAIAGMALPVLQSRTRIARENALYLREERRSLTKQDKTYDEIYEYLQWRRIHEQIGTANQNHRNVLRAVPSSEETSQQAAVKIPEVLKQPETEIQVEAGPDIEAEAETEVDLPQELQTKQKEATLSDIQSLIQNLDLPDEGEGLDSLTMELARILGIESYISHWFKYEEGETGIFTQVLADSIGPELKEAAIEKYKNNSEFVTLTDKYMALFESLIAQRVEGSSDQMATIDKMLKTDPGKVYATLAKACGRV